MLELKINGERLWASLSQLATIGATPDGGVCRLALTDPDKWGRDLVVSWCRDAGCRVSIDQMGNIFARRDGLDSGALPVATGSHLDTQPTGGRFDGAYGVLAGLEAIRTLNDHGVETQAPVELVVWTNEEGSRFAPAMVASGVFAGVFDLEYGRSRRDMDGITLGAELARIGYAGPMRIGHHRFGAFFEAHIEQGPILEARNCTIGVVIGAQGQRWYEVRLVGQEAHAGPTPMLARRDALLGAARVVSEVNRIGLVHQPYGCATVGLLNVMPNSRNTIPGEAFLTVDFRHPSAEVLGRMDDELRASVDRIARESGLQLELEQIWSSPPVDFDAGCIRTIREAADKLDLSHLEIISGAGHDACYINRVAPTGMIFIPCEGGLSHNESERAAPADVIAGAQVLLMCILKKSGAR